MTGIRIPMSDLEERRVYRVRSRNLLIGAWVPERRGFIGIREKFGDRYPFTEYHYDIGPPYGTAWALVALDVYVPEHISLTEHLPGLICECGRAAERIPDAEIPGPWHRHVDDGSLIELGDDDHSTFVRQNVELREFLDPLDRRAESEKEIE